MRGGRRVAAAALLFISTAACDDARTSDRCGTGGVAVRGDDRVLYCVYRGAPDQTCPEAIAFPLLVGATRVCSEVERTVEQLPPEVCDVIGANACQSADGGFDAGVDPEMDADIPDDGGRIDGGPRPDSGPRDAGPACPPVPWDAATTVISATSMSNHLSLATSEASDVGYVHLGVIADSRVNVVTRDLDDPSVARGRADLTRDWSLVGERSVAVHRDVEDGSVWVAVTHRGTTTLPSRLATIGRIAPGDGDVTPEGDFQGSEEDAMLARATITGSGTSLRFVWRVRHADTPAVLASLGRSFVPESYREAEGVADDELAEVRGTTGRVVVAPGDDGQPLLWDTLPEGSSPAPDRVSVTAIEARAALAYEGGDSYVMAYPGSDFLYVRRVDCAAGCLAGEELSTRVGADLRQTTIDAVPGGYLVGITERMPSGWGGSQVFYLVGPDLRFAGLGPMVAPHVTPTEGVRIVYDVETSVVQHHGESNLVVAVLVGPPGSTSGTSAYVTGLRFPASCP